MKTDIQQQAIDLQTLIHKNDYFIALYHNTLEQHKIHLDGINSGLYSDYVIVNMFNTFWGSLPDSMAIHREPFDLLCDICASGFNED